MNRTLEPIKQEGPGSYFGKLETDYTIDWNDPAEVIRNAVRVYASPYARARTSLHDRSILVNHVDVLDEGDRYATQSPGEIVDVLHRDALVVAVPDGFVLMDDYEVLPPMTEAEEEDLLRRGSRLL